MTSRSFYFQVLPDTQKTVLAEIGPAVSEHEFYLAGGTAVALHLGHRRSVDLDWFTHRTIDDPQRFAGQLRDDGVDLTVEEVGPGTLHGTVDGVNVSFLSYRYSLLEPLVDVPEPSFQMASLVDLACMKLGAVAQRGARKDFIDVYAIEQSVIDFPDMIGAYRRKYDVEDIGHLLAAVCYFDDAEKEPMPVVFDEIDWAVLKDALRKRVREFAGSS